MIPVSYGGGQLCVKSLVIGTLGHLGMSFRVCQCIHLNSSSKGNLFETRLQVNLCILQIPRVSSLFLNFHPCLPYTGSNCSMQFHLLSQSSVWELQPELGFSSLRVWGPTPSTTFWAFVPFPMGACGAEWVLSSWGGWGRVWPSASQAIAVGVLCRPGLWCLCLIFCKNILEGKLLLDF